MTITKNTRPYEALFRFHSDGTVAAHVQYIEEVVEDGVVLAATEQHVTPLALAGPEFDEVLNAVNVAVVSERDALNVAMSSMVTDLDKVKTERDALNVTMETMETDLATVKAERDALIKDQKDDPS